MGAWVRGAGDVGGEERELAVLGLDEPDEAGAEHGVGGGDEFGAEGVDRGEGGFESALKGGGHGGRVGREGGEKEVVVVRHGGVVEEGCH